MNPTTRKLQTKLALIGLLRENRRMTLEDLSKYSGVKEISDLKKELGKLYMVGSYPYTPDQLVEIDYDGETIGIRLPNRMQEGLTMSVREWSGIRSLLLEEEQKEVDPERRQILLSSLRKIHTVLPSSGILDSGELKSQLTEAIERQKSVLLEYQAQGETSPVKRKVDPWGLLSYKEEYLIGFCHTRNAPRSFRLDSILTFERTEEKSIQVPDQERKKAISRLKQFLRSSGKEGAVAEIFHTAEVYFNLHRRFGLERTKESVRIRGTVFYLSRTNIRNEDWFLSTLKGFGNSVILKSPTSLKQRLQAYWKEQLGEIET
ncbi:WYL domain-containing protein [Leptospira fletcheri]|uniref:WYL domain-containing protein n=1 Tax=Leptospira fletcheri TaxID=2484981 RepID=A0A4V3JDM8_9LEPT|nr:WYL domain-containing protein [Leptospira fletcheri]TGK11385.1 WYL domain-containing protein [Leptospira fletcheri]